MKRILRYVKGTTQLGLHIRFASSFDLYAFCDADWAERYLERGARIKTFSYTNQRDSKVSGGFDVADLFPSKKFLHVLTGLRPKLLKIHYKLDKILDNIISERREILASIQKGNTDSKEGEGLIDVLLRLQESSGLELPITSNNVKVVIMVCMLVMV
ncbi:hypothetical protein RJ639_022005 [Escallonia herrerae]|uniref:Uncharacterized protein n=1 Tax=Escallonia herrerae TaxID=1293975 RepID=A0AA88V645_9ASTE|nr:hypothetical protein RJ639_022005 [Escallonia herrerae]